MSRSLDIPRTSAQECTRSKSDSHGYIVKEWPVTSKGSCFTEARLDSFDRDNGNGIIARDAQEPDRKTSPSDHSFLRAVDGPSIFYDEPPLKQSPYYKPIPLRDWYQGFVLATVIILVCLTGVAVRILPDEKTFLAPTVQVQMNNETSVQNRELATFKDFDQNGIKIPARGSDEGQEFVGSQFMTPIIECPWTTTTETETKTATNVGDDEWETITVTTTITTSYTGALKRTLDACEITKTSTTTATEDPSDYIGIGTVTITLTESILMPTNVATTAQQTSSADTDSLPTETWPTAIPATTEFTTKASNTPIPSQSKSETTDSHTSRVPIDGEAGTTRDSETAATGSSHVVETSPSVDVGTSEVNSGSFVATMTDNVRTTIINGSPATLTDIVRATTINGSPATLTDIVRATMINGSPTTITDSARMTIINGSPTVVIDSARITMINGSPAIVGNGVRATINSGSSASMTGDVRTTVINGLTATITGGSLTAIVDGSLTTIVDISPGLNTNIIDALVYSSYTTVFTNSEGAPTTQLVYLADAMMWTSMEGQEFRTRPGLTLVTDFPLASSLQSKTSSLSSTTATSSSNPGSSGSPTDSGARPGTAILQVYIMTEGQYFVGLFLCTLLSTSLAIPLRVIDFNVRLYRPFHNLLSNDGNEASRSLLLATTGVSSYFSNSDTITRLTGGLVVLSAILIPISAEAIHAVLHGDGCQSGKGTAHNCAMTLGVSAIPAYIAITILSLIGALILLAWFQLRHYRTGVHGKPWNLAFMSRFSSDPKIQSLVANLDASTRQIKQKDLLRVFEPWLYIIEAQTNATGSCRVAIFDKSHRQELDERRDLIPQENSKETKTQFSKFRAAPSFVLTPYGRVLTLLFISGVLALVLAYEQNSSANGFEDFMDSENIGVRFLFSGIGVVLTLIWAAFFQGIAWLSPYKIASKGIVPAQAQKILELTLPTNPFSGLYRVVSGSHPDAYLGIVSLIAILTQVLPTFLVNVPFRMVETYKTHVICVWFAVAIMVGMICTVLGSFFVELPNMPVDPSTIVGAMYYATVDRTSYHNRRDYQRLALREK